MRQILEGVRHFVKEKFEAQVASYVPAHHALEQNESENEKSDSRRFRLMKHLRTFLSGVRTNVRVLASPLIKNLRTALAEDPLPVETVKELLGEAA